MRHPRACAQCREGKRKCVRQGIGESCEPCAHRRLKCALLSTQPPPTHREVVPRAVTDQIGPQPSVERLLDANLQIDLVNLYFEKIHDRPYSLFHASTLRAEVHSGTLNHALLLAICGTGSRFAEQEKTRELERQLMGESKRLLLADLENICVENVQCCVLIANLCAAHLNPTSEALYFRIANGMAQILGLDAAPSAGLPIAAREVRRRVWWTLVMADRWSSFGLGLPRQIAEADGPVDLPMDEAVFQSLQTLQMESGTPWTPGLWAQMIQLVRLFGPIQDLNKRSAAGEFGPEELSRHVDRISYSLRSWENALPGNFNMSKESLDFHESRGTGGPFVALHLGFYHYSALLYFQFLENGSSSRYVEQCKFYAAAYSELLRESRRRQNCHALYATVAHMAVVSSSVLLHTLLYGEEHELDGARILLNSNFEAILELERYWPSCSLMVSRLVTFQNFCLLAESHTHRLDGWMVRFLMEHSLPLEDKDFFTMATHVSPGSRDISARAQELSDQGRYTVFDQTTQDTQAPQ